MKPRNLNDGVNQAFPTQQAPDDLRSRIESYRPKSVLRPIYKGTIVATVSAACVTAAFLLVPTRQAQAEYSQAISNTMAAKTAIIVNKDTNGKETGRFYFKNGRSLITSRDGKIWHNNQGQTTTSHFDTLGITTRYETRIDLNPHRFIDPQRFISSKPRGLKHEVKIDSRGQEYDQYTHTQGSFRSILDVSRETKSPFTYRFLVKVRNVWQTTVNQDIQLNVPVDDSLVAMPTHNDPIIDISIDTAKKWIHNLEANPLGTYLYKDRDCKRAVTFYDVTVTQNGHVFVLFTAANFRSDFGAHLLRVTDNLGTVYATQDMFHPFQNWQLKGRPANKQEPFWVGGKELCARWFVPVGGRPARLPSKVTISVDPKQLTGMNGVIMTPSTAKLSQEELQRLIRRTNLVGKDGRLALEVTPKVFDKKVIPPFMVFFNSNLWSKDDVAFLEWNAIATYWQDRNNLPKAEVALLHALEAIKQAKEQMGADEYPYEYSTITSYLECLKHQGKTKEANRKKRFFEETSLSYQSAEAARQDVKGTPKRF